MTDKDPTLDEMLEIAAAREAENTIKVRVSEEDYQKVVDALDERQELAKKTFEELTTNEKIQLALEEIDYIVLGGQDGQEFYGSIQFLRKVLRSLVDNT
jgi:uncharacterized protein YpiB (UPF0302 family)